MPVQLEALAAVANLCAGEVRELRHSKKEGCVIENTMVRSGTPIRDTSCCYRPLTGVPCLRFGPRRTSPDRRSACGSTGRRCRTARSGTMAERLATAGAVVLTVVLLHPPLPLVGVSMRQERECQQNNSTGVF